MIFDILGIINFKSRLENLSLDKIFFSQFYKNIKCQRYQIKSADFQIFLLSHNEFNKDFIATKDFLVIVIGDPHPKQEFDKAICQLSSQVILKLYNDYGTDSINYLKGNFQIVILDKKKCESLIFNSRFGASPFYYAFKDNVLLFSTSLRAIMDCNLLNKTLDKIAIGEYAIFGYPLGDRTIFKDMKSLPPASYLIVKDGHIEVKKYWDCRSLIDQELYSQKKALEVGSELFKKTVNQYTQNPNKICISLTGGFDGRAILSVLEKDPPDFICYSFGIHGSLNISIPERICKENNINYLPIYLDEEYENVYDEYAMQAIYFSDCLSTFERANYPYAFKKLSKFSPIIITGIFGSELMRTFQNVAIGYMVNENYVKINFARDKKTILASIIKHTKENSYYNAKIFEDFDELLEHIYEECIKRYQGLTDNQRFYLFLLNEGARKYFGGEVQMERIYAVNRFPFLDDNFVEFVFKSPFSGIYSNPLKPTIKQRFNSQFFYSYIIKKYRPQLLNYTTDHGYPPKHLLSKAPLLQIGPGFLFKRIKQRLTGYREFKTEEWSENFYKNHLLKRPVDDNLFSKQLEDDLVSGLWRKKRIDFARGASLKLYLELLSLWKDSSNASVM